MADQKYQILDGHQPYPLAARTAGRVKALRLLQVSSAYYSDRDRYGLAKEMLLADWITNEEEDTERGVLRFEIREPEISADEFRVRVAALLFPDAPVDANPDAVDLEQVEAALAAFLGFIEPRHRRQQTSLPWQEIYRAAMNGNTVPSEATPTPTAG